MRGRAPASHCAGVATTPRFKQAGSRRPASRLGLRGPVRRMPCAALTGVWTAWLADRRADPIRLGRSRRPASHRTARSGVVLPPGSRARACCALASRATAPATGSADRALAARRCRRRTSRACRSLCARWSPGTSRCCSTDASRRCRARPARDADFVSLVPTQLHRLLETDAEALRRLPHRAARRRPDRPGAAPSRPRTPACAWSRRTARPRPPAAASTTATPLDGVAVAIDAGGRVRIGGPTLFDGYDGDPAAPPRCCVDGWFLTSDAGRLDEDGRLQVLGRIDDVVVSGGVNVPAPAVAARLREHPAVAAAEVLGVPDEEWGNRVVAFVVRRRVVARTRPGTWVARGARRGPGRRDSWSCSTRSRCCANGKLDRLAPAEDLRMSGRRSLPMRTRFRGITVREGMLLRAPPGGGSGARSWSTTPRSPSPGCAAPRRPPPATGRRRCATACRSTSPCPRSAPSRRTRSCCAAAAAPPRSRSPSPARPSPTTRPGSRRCATRSGPAAGSASTSTGCGTVDAAVASIAVLDRAAGGLEYVEQPCAQRRGPGARYAARVDVPIAADESIRRAEDPYRVRDLEAADVAVLKVQPLGGVRACLRIAEDIGLPVVVSSALETSVGIAAGVALAAALPELPYACGLATVQLLDGRRRRPSRCCRSTARCRCGCRSSTSRWCTPTPRPGRALGGPAGRGASAAAGSIARERHRHRPRRRHRADRGGRHRGRDRAGLAQRAAVASRRTTRPPPGCSGCTPGSTSAPPASSPSG